MSDKNQDPAYEYKGQRPVVLPEVPPWRRRKKNTRDWCKGHVGRTHVSEIVVPENRFTYDRVCRRPPEWWFRAPINMRVVRQGGRMRDWWCRHVVRCTVCHKVLRNLAPGECPDRPTS